MRIVRLPARRRSAILSKRGETAASGKPAERGRFPHSSLAKLRRMKTVIPLTSAQCLAIAERKMGEAKGDRRHGKELEATARAWLVLADRVAEGEALELAKVAAR